MRLIFFLLVVAAYCAVGVVIYAWMRKYMGICRDEDRNVETFRALSFVVAWPLAAPIHLILGAIKSVNEDTRPRPTPPPSKADLLLEKEIRKAQQELNDGRYSKYEND